MSRPYLDTPPPPSPATTWLALARECAHAIGADHAAVLGRRRSAAAALARRFAWWRMREETELSYPEIGRASGYDPTSVAYGARLFAMEAGIVEWRG